MIPIAQLMQVVRIRQSAIRYTVELERNARQLGGDKPGSQQAQDRPYQLFGVWSYVLSYVLIDPLTGKTYQQCLECNEEKDRDQG